MAMEQLLSSLQSNISNENDVFDAGHTPNPYQSSDIQQPDLLQNMSGKAHTEKDVAEEDQVLNNGKETNADQNFDSFVKDNATPTREAAMDECDKEAAMATHHPELATFINQEHSSGLVSPKKMTLSKLPVTSSGNKPLSSPTSTQPRHIATGPSAHSTGGCSVNSPSAKSHLPTATATSGIPKFSGNVAHNNSPATTNEIFAAEEAKTGSPTVLRRSMRNSNNTPNRKVELRQSSTFSAADRQGKSNSRRLPQEQDDMALRVNRLSLDIEKHKESKQQNPRYQRESSADIERQCPLSPTKSQESEEGSVRQSQASNGAHSSSSNCRHSYSSQNTQDCGVITSKINSLQNIKHKPAGGHVKIFDEKLEFKTEKGKCGTLDNVKYKPGGGNVKIYDEKIEFKAESKIGSLNNCNYKPGGGDVKILNRKLDFGEKAKSKISSLEKASHKPKGGDKKIFNEQLPWLKHNKPNLSAAEKARINKKRDSSSVSSSKMPLSPGVEGGNAAMSSAHSSTSK